MSAKRFLVVPLLTALACAPPPSAERTQWFLKSRELTARYMMFLNDKTYEHLEHQPRDRKDSSLF